MTIFNHTEKTAGSTVADNSKKIWICKTNIATRKDLEKVEYRLNEHPNIIKWNIDWYDDDRVLRVVAESLELSELVALVSDAGYDCEELPD